MTIRVNNKAVEAFKFSGGECHVRINPADINEITTIDISLTNSDQVMNLLLVVDAIRRIHAETKIYLTIPYFPYARQDRVCNVGEPLSVKVMANLINGLNCAKVTLMDPHSDVSAALLNQCKVIALAEIIANSDLANVIHEKNMSLISPDAGAEKKVHATAKMIARDGQAVEVLSASKIRDSLSGKITATHIYGAVTDKDYIILDDICDGGATFIELAKELKKRGAHDIYLYVTHGIFSKSLTVLKEYFKHIYCYHTMLAADQVDDTFLTILAK